MADTVKSIDEEIAKLELKKQEIIESEKTAKIIEVKAIIKQYGLTASQLGLKGKGNGTPSPAKYANPANTTETWTGKGRKPNWLEEYLNSGKTLDSALIK